MVVGQLAYIVMLSPFDSLRSLRAGSAKHLKSIVIMPDVIRDSSTPPQNDNELTHYPAMGSESCQQPGRTVAEPILEKS